MILAAAKVGGIVANNKYRGEFLFENIQVQNNVIHNAYLSGVKKLLFLGSTCIYPKSCPQPIKEESLLTGELEYTNEPYAIAKIAGIKMCESYNLQFGTNYISVMPTNLYGPNDNFNLETSHVLPALVRKFHLAKLLSSNDFASLQQELDIDDKLEISKYLSQFGVFANKVEIWGTGTPMREFLWSEDMADACVHILENVEADELAEKYSKEGLVRNNHINIGTGVDISIKDLANKIKDIVGFNGAIYFNVDKPDGTPKKLTDVSRLHDLGWKHKVDLDSGLQLMYNAYLEKKSGIRR